MAYLFLAYSPEDEKRVQPLLEELKQRGCHVRFSTGKAKNIKEADEHQKLMNGASLILYYLSKNAAENTALKGDVLYLRSKGTPVIIWAADEGISRLETGLPEDTPETEDVEELIRTEGFTREMIDDSLQPVNRVCAPVYNPWPRRIAAVIAAAVLIALAGFFVSRAGAKDAHADPETTAVLELKKLPEDLSELEAYPKLEKIVIPQSEAEKALPLLGKYTVVLTEG